MAAVTSEKMDQCPHCGAGLPGDATTCPACGAPLAVPGGDLPQSERAGLRELVETSNRDLVEAGANAAESAFGLSCSLGVLLTTILLFVIFLLGERNWIVLAIIALGAALVAAAVSAVLASRAKSATIAGAYQRTVRPNIERHLRSRRLSQPDFDLQAAESLAEDAPLRNYLSPPSGQEGRDLEE